MGHPIKHRALNPKQIYLLKAIYKFRFVSSELLANGNKNRQRVINQRLRLLLDQGYIYRHFDGSYRLQNQPAAYCLAPDGIKWLKANTDLNQKVLHTAYKDRSAGRPFIDHCLNVFRVYNKFKELYPDRFLFFTKSEQRPNLGCAAYLTDGRSDREYALDILDDQLHSFGIRKKLQQLLKVVEENNEAELETALYICEGGKLERSLQNQAARIKNYTEADLDIYSTSMKAFMSSQSQSIIWSGLDDPDKLVNIF